MHSDLRRSQWKQKVVGRFDMQASQYGQNNDIQDEIAQTLATHLPPIPNANILEIGCGTGALTRHLLNQYPDAQFHITDISQRMVNAARQSISTEHQIEWGIMDGELPTSDRQYDLIVSSMAFQWFENHEAALTQLTKMLKPSGHLFFSVPSAKSFKEWRETLSSLSLPHGFPTTPEWPQIFKEEEITIDYGNTLNFLKTLRKTGANIPHNHYRMLQYSELKHACKVNDRKHGGKTTWHILYGHITRS
ncbi:MAG: methyltransferase [Alphaproteobacteria bacterium]